MKAISLLQPYASLIAVGAKKYETRSWKTNYRGLMAIHASKGWNPIQRSLLAKEVFQKSLSSLAKNQEIITKEHLPFGSIIAYCELIDCIPTTELNPNQIANERYFGDFTPGRYAWLLADIRQIESIPAKGKLGLWDVNGSAELAIMF